MLWDEAGPAAPAGPKSATIYFEICVKVIKHVAVATEWLVVLKQCCCNQCSGGVPLPFAHSGNIKMACTHKRIVF